ncbi:transcriptional regulator, SARP family [Anaeromyxobacter dehalogenans 2CP-C]|uniref:Transcriptional regulator, SARP family n=2 Tax=Anaeromyxobacter dehalogenans TaxID=161493 RepID=Q2IMR2_ANADE|nr:transcriptional regulator, SARP family [Anaeromyxobacter dehalogenans 2CP-C]
MMHPSPNWTVHLLGAPRLAGATAMVRLDRRTAALLALLAIDGPQPRSRAAGLLWPESPEKTARANLRQLLRRLREAAGGDLVGAGDPLELSPAVSVDVRGGPRPEEAWPDGRLLDGVDLEEAPELSEWLTGARRTLDAARLDAALAAAARLEAAGRLGAALAEVQRALALEPLSEEAHRREIRLRYLGGDRAAALAAYERCRATLRATLGVEPSSETSRLADEVARGRRVPARPAGAASLPLSVTRPPALAGREREWALMEEAWAAGKGIALGGAPGVGKSRLMQDFLSTHARPLFFEGRPGDRAVPYGTHARTFRETLGALSSAGVALPPWVRAELARMLPELGPSPGPLATEADRVRFWNAKLEAMRVAFRAGFDALGFDDTQFVDPASAAAGTYVLEQLLRDTETPLRTVHCFRTAEMPPDVLAHIRALAEAGRALYLELEPLADDAVEELVRSLDVPGIERVAAEVARYAGGSPLFALETVKHLVETGAVERGIPDRTPPRLEALLRARFERLSAPALQLARALGVLGTDFTLERAAAVVEARAMDVAVGWSELEAAQLVRGTAFGHDLLAEAVVAATPAPLRSFLHRRAAEVLAATDGAPGRIAAHWERAGDPIRADACRREAESAARTTLLATEAAGYFRAA